MILCGAIRNADDVTGCTWGTPAPFWGDRLDMDNGIFLAEGNGGTLRRHHLPEVFREDYFEIILSKTSREGVSTSVTCA